MGLVNEDEYGAYQGVRAEFLKKFILKESNPNFEVYDSIDGNNRFIAVKSSRIPDDEDLTAGRYGINFHRAKPTFQEANHYRVELLHTLETTKWLNEIAFAAASREEYNRKSSAWESFYSYIWGPTPLSIWIAPHSGNVNRPPDDIFPYPKWEMDGFTAGIAAACAFSNNTKPSKRVIISIHSHNWPGALLDLGGFGVIEEQKLADTAKKIESKYHEEIKVLANGYKKDFSIRSIRWLEHIKNTKSTLNPQELKQVSATYRSVVQNITKALRLYGKEIKEFKLAEFKAAIKILQRMDIPVASCNYLFPASHVGKLIRISEKISHGLLDSALQIECLKLNSIKEPELITRIILDIKNELLG